METWRSRIRQGPVRALIAVCLLAGVFTMHGLTGNHDAAMVRAHQLPATAAADHPAPGAAVRPAPGHLKQAAPAAAHPSFAETGRAAAPSYVTPLQPRQALTFEPDRDRHLHAMGDVCLAMLAGLLLALIIALARRSRTVAHPIEVAGSAVLVAVDRPTPPWRRPTLSKLCLLRT